MFTGLVQAVGEVLAIAPGAPARLRISSPWAAGDIALGASIAHDGCCLTVVASGDGWHEVEASEETLAVTTLGQWAVGARVNLERALRLGDELGGHMITGHIDGVGHIYARTPHAGHLHLGFEAPADLARFIAPKGSITVDGVSLTVNRVDGARFEVAIIPHTEAVTTLGDLALGDAVNLEIDIVARYIARQREFS